MTDLKPEDLVKLIEPEKATAFLEEAARYFSKLPHNGEDRAYWANVYNADNCRRISALVSSLLADRARMEKALQNISIGRPLLSTDKAEWIEYVTDLARQALGASQ